MTEIRNMYRILVEKYIIKRTLGRPRLDVGRSY